ncbi:glycosyltransferase family 2 protein [Gramella sp. KN1008]|uniref:glycosyltransferase family 2 protein n=1 Tax=Gramella sp. KN1008 TaxID=2529298 RepID=UPI001039BE5B|nr:glycosyltransferase family 2 protein [Gramella sp. KN1008]TBW25570.1 glycosyltransferase family 2 protein [Gramella sp. KN1008]
MEPLISLIIPIYNRYEFIGETLDSIIAQTYKNWECIVVDDGSNDYMVELMEFYKNSDARIHYYKRPSSMPKGANSCRNYGYSQSKGAYVNWFDSDDLMKRNFLEEKIKSFKTDTDMVISRHELLDNEGKFIRKEKRTHASERLLKDYVCLDVSWYLPDPMYRRSFLKEKKLFDEKLLRGQDRDFHIRMLLENPKIVFVEKYLTGYRQSHSSISNDLSVEVVMSNYEAVDRQIDEVLSQENSNEIKYFYLKDQLKKYQYLWKVKGMSRKNFQLFRRLAFPGFHFFRWLIKYALAVVSFKFIGKGYVFLKGN